MNRGGSGWNASLPANNPRERNLMSILAIILLALCALAPMFKGGGR